MVYLLSSMIFLSLGLLFTLFVTVFYWKKLSIRHRLEMLDDVVGKQEVILEDRKKLSFEKRVIEPIRRKITETTRKITPKGTLSRIDEKLKAANYPFHMGVLSWILLRCVFIVAFPAVYFFFFMENTESLIMRVTGMLVAFLAGDMIPIFLLNNKIKERKIKMTQQLPDILDLLTVSVEAGLSFDGAMEKVASRGTNEMTMEFGKAVKEIGIGKTRRQALKDMSKRCDLPDLQIFISSIIQAEQMGVSIGKILRIQADNIRVKRRQRAQETALKAPVKMLFPLILFIFPSLFIVLLGPAMIKMMEVF